MNDQKIAEEWIKTIEDPSSQHIRNADIYPKLKDWFDKTQASKILEIGCGQGICSQKMALSQCSYTGLDPSPPLIKRAQELYQSHKHNFVLGSAEKLPFLNQEFDAIFSIAVWHLLPDIALAAAELSRVLKLGGSLLIISANPAAYSTWTQPYMNPQMNGRKFTGEIELSDSTRVTETLFLHSQKEILDSLAKAQLKIESINTFRQIDEHHQFIEIHGRKVE